MVKLELLGVPQFGRFSLWGGLIWFFL